MGTGVTHSRKEICSIFFDPHHSIADQITKAYEYRDGWVNRMILGDSLVVMNSLIHFENLAGQVQMIYMDPPYGVKFGSNFQPFIRKREVSDGDDEDMTREPEVVQAYRDVWELGLHTYLTYLCDRLILSRELLASKGSIFVQINDQNVHIVRNLMDEVFGAENAIVTIVLKKKGATTATDPVNDFILWYARDKEQAKPRIKRLAEKRSRPEEDPKFNTLISTEGDMKRVTGLPPEEVDELVLKGWRWARVNYPIVSQHPHPERSKDYYYKGKAFTCGKNGQWRFDVPGGMDRLAEAGRLHDSGGKSLGGVLFWNDWPYVGLSNVWDDIKGEENPAYVVQTAWKPVQRCILMSTEPGDLIIDPTCGSGTTAFVAEQWGRRWITIDTSRVPLALARQRLLTATYTYYQLTDEKRGPAGGFVYKRRQNTKGEEVGGIVPHIKLSSIADNEPPAEVVLVDRPEPEPKVTRVSGNFTVEGTIPPPVEMTQDSSYDSVTGTDTAGKFSDRMLEVLRKCPVLRLEGNREITLKNVRPPAKALTLSAEAIQTGDEEQPVAFVFGPENGAVTETLVHQSLREANMKGYVHLYVVGFAIQPNARKLIDEAAVMGVPATYVQATPDLMMGDLLKNLRSSQIFSVCGLPEVEVQPAEDGKYQVSLIGLDVFDPVTMEVDHRKGDDVPAWFLDTDYNGLCFHVCQAFFPRTSAWDNLKKALKGTYDDDVWDHLAGTTSTPFEPGEHREIAVKVIDDRGNELLVVKRLP